MKRMDRLFAILMALQQRQETAQSLADKFEVSKRTILRDMQALSEIGVPLYAVSGPSGGFRMMEGFALPPLQLEPREALTVLFALQSITKLKETPFNSERWTVLDKVLGILPADTIKQVEPLLKRVEVAVPSRRYTTPHLSPLLQHTADGRWLSMDYRSANHKRRLQVKPIRVYTAHGFWYCEAYSVTHGTERTFRVDRIDAMEAIEAPEPRGDEPVNPAMPPAHPEPIRILARLTYKGMLAAEQDEHIGEHLSEVSEDEWELDFMCPQGEWDWFIRFFYSLGMDAEVLEPEAMRNDIRRMAGQVANRYEGENPA